MKVNLRGRNWIVDIEIGGRINLRSENGRTGMSFPDAESFHEWATKKD